MADVMNEKKLHRDCPEHDEANCDINDHDNLDPSEDDCGHYVAAGPGTLDTPDLNTYTEDCGKKAIVAGPNHNLDQDPTHGPGVK